MQTETASTRGMRAPRAGLADRRPSPPPSIDRRGRTRKALETRRRILDASVDVLRRDGHAGFSIPRVAREADVFQGNITYYYPTREALLEAVADHILAGYRIEIEKVVAGIDPVRGDWAEGLVRWLLDDAVAPATVRLSPELWSIANRHEEAAGTVQRLYDDGVVMIVRALGHDPETPAAGPLVAAVYALIAAVEGTTAIHGHRPAGDPIFLAAREATIALHAPALVSASRGLARRS